MSTNNVTSKGNMVGIDIGNDYIKVSEIISDQAGLNIAGLGMVKVPDGVIVDEDIKDVSLLGNTIKQLLRDSSITSKKCVVSYSGATRVFTKIIEVPKINTEKQISASVKYEVEKVFPYSANDTEIDWSEMPSDDSEDQSLKIFAAAAHRKIVEDILRTVTVAGLSLVAIEISGLAIGRSAVNSSAVASNSVVAVLNIGAKNTELSVFKGSTIVNPVIKLVVNGDTLTKALCASMDIDFEEAENLKKEYAIITMDKIESYLDGDSTNLDFDIEEFDTPFDDPNYNPLVADSDFGFGDTEDSKFNFDEGFDVDLPLDEDKSVSESDAQVEDLLKENYNVDSNVDSSSAEQSDGVTNKSDDILMAMLPDLLDLTREVRLQLEDYYSTTGILIDKLIISGGTAKISGITSLFERQVGLPTSLVSMSDNFNISNSSSDVLGDLNCVYPVSVGLAVRNFIE